MPIRTRIREIAPGFLQTDDGRFETVRFYKARDAGFSGWVVRSTSDQYLYSDPLPNRAAAIRTLRAWAADPALSR